MNEEFDKWWNEHRLQHGLNRMNKYHHAQAAFLAGAAAMRERCAEVAEADDTCECGCSSDYECNHCAIKKNIAAAIRGQK